MMSLVLLVTNPKIHLNVEITKLYGNFKTQKCETFFMDREGHGGHLTRFFSLNFV